VNLVGLVASKQFPKLKFLFSLNKKKQSGARSDALVRPVMLA
jgi:hypothetical protein